MEVRLSSLSKRPHVVVDIETNGTVCPIYNLLSIGAVHHENPTNTFYAEMRPLNDNFEPIAYQVNGFTHDQVQEFEHPSVVMPRFLYWTDQIKKDADRIYFVSDTTSFDFSFVNFYLWYFCYRNPFGHAPLSLTNLYKGLTGNLGANIYALRDTTHTHNALDDAKGNQEAFAKIEKMLAKQRRRVANEKMVISGS